MDRRVEVPEGCKAVFVSDRLAAEYADWAEIHACEAMAVPTDHPLVLDVVTRYIGHDKYE